MGQKHKLNTKVNKAFILRKSHAAAVTILCWGSGGEEACEAKQITFFCWGVVSRQEWKGHTQLQEGRQLVPKTAVCLTHGL